MRITHLLTHPPTHSLTHGPTHSLTHSLLTHTRRYVSDEDEAPSAERIEGNPRHQALVDGHTPCIDPSAL